jgi:hypothetical protein
MSLVIEKTNESIRYEFGAGGLLDSRPPRPLAKELLLGLRCYVRLQRFLGFDLSKLPVLGFEEVLEMFLAVFGFPVVAPELRFKDDLLAFLSQSSEILSRLSPHGHVYESSDLLALAIGVVEELVVSDRGRSHWSSRASLSQGRVSDQVTTDDDAIDIHE